MNWTKQYSKARSFFKYALSTLIALFIMLLLLEIALRVKAAVTHADIGSRGDEIHFIRHSYYNPFLIFGPNRNKDVLQNTGGVAHFNSQGFRLDEDLPVEKEPDEYRIFALGGSTTEEAQNRANKHYCGEATKHFAQMFPDRKIICVNAAKSAYSTAHSLIRLQTDILAYEPDIITVMHNINDLEVNFFPFDGRYNYGTLYLNDSYASSPNILETLRRRSRAIDYVLNKLGKIQFTSSFHKVYTTDDGEVLYGNLTFAEEPNELALKETFKDNLRSIVAIGQMHGSKVILLTQPAQLTEEKYYKLFAVTKLNVGHPPPEEFKKLFLEYDAAIEEVARETGAGFIDLYEKVPHEDAYFNDIVHTSPEGVTKVGEIYFQELLKYIN